MQMAQIASWVDILRAKFRAWALEPVEGANPTPTSLLPCASDSSLNGFVPQFPPLQNGDGDTHGILLTGSCGVKVADRQGPQHGAGVCRFLPAVFPVLLWQQRTLRPEKPSTQAGPAPAHLSVGAGLVSGEHGEPSFGNRACPSRGHDASGQCL